MYTMYIHVRVCNICIHYMRIANLACVYANDEKDYVYTLHIYNIHVGISNYVIIYTYTDTHI